MARTALRFDSRRGLELELCRSRQPTYGGGLWDAFLTKFNPTCTALVYSTYMGSTLDDRGYAIAVYRDASDNMRTSRTSPRRRVFRRRRVRSRQPLSVPGTRLPPTSGFQGCVRG